MLSGDGRTNRLPTIEGIDLESSTVVRRVEAEKIDRVIQSLKAQLGAEAVFLAGRSGQPIACSGSLPTEDFQSLASLSTGVVAAASGLAPLMQERFVALHCAGSARDFRLAPVGDEAVLLMTFLRDAPPCDEVDLRRALLILEDILRKARRHPTAGTGAL